MLFRSIRNDTVYKFIPHGLTKIEGWAESIPGRLGEFFSVGLFEPYEAWAHMAQEKIILAPGNETLVAGMENLVDDYFDFLGRTVDERLRLGGREEAHEIVNYFGVLMGHILGRAFPLDHPVVLRCLDRMERIDPLPEHAAKDCVRMLYGVPQERDEILALGADAMAMRLRASVPRCHWAAEEIIWCYKSRGMKILPEVLGEVFTYRQLRLAQLLKIGGLHIHTPGLENKTAKKLHKKADRLTLDMVKAAAKTAGYVS